MNEVKKDPNIHEYIYDTPIGVIQKEGAMYRGMGTYDPNRPLWVRIFAIVFASLIFLLPGIGFIVSLVWNLIYSAPEDGLSYYGLLLMCLIFGLFFLYAGSVVIRNNIKKSVK